MLKNKCSVLWSTCVFAILFFGTELGFAQKSLTGTLKIAGGTAPIPFFKAMADQLRSQSPQLNIFIAGGGSGVGVQKLGSGLIDIASTGRPLSSEEKKRFDLVSNPFANDAIVLVVHPQNPLSNLSISEAQRIFAGEQLNWQKGASSNKGASPIHVYVRDESSGSQDFVLRRILKEKRLHHSALFTNSQGAMKMAIANDPNGIGFISLSYLDSSVKALRVNGHAANLKTIESRRYPLVRTLYLSTQRNPPLLVKQFIRKLQDKNSAVLLRKWGLLPTHHPLPKSSAPTRNT